MQPTNSEKKFLQAVVIFTAMTLLACALIFQSSASLLEAGLAALLIALALWKLRVRKRKRSFSFYSELAQEDQGHQVDRVDHGTGGF